MKQLTTENAETIQNLLQSMIKATEKTLQGSTVENDYFHEKLYKLNLFLQVIK